MELTDEQVRTMREAKVFHGQSYGVLATRFGIARRSVIRICKGETRVEAGGPVIGLLDEFTVAQLREFEHYPPVADEPPAYGDRCHTCGGLYCGDRCHACHVRTLIELDLIDVKLFD